MARTPSIYSKLTRRHRGGFGYSQLWLGPDHILLLNSSRIAEEYKRFAFADIQSIVVTELPSRTVAQVVLTIAALAWMALWFAVQTPFAKWSLLVTGAIGLLIPIVDIARGTRCRCYLHTEVSQEHLAPVSRTKIAQKFLASVRPAIEGVQGVLPQAEIAAIEVPFVTAEPAPPEIVTPPGYLPEILFGTFLLNAILIWLTIRLPKANEVTAVLINTLGAEVILIVVAGFRRKGRDPRVIVYTIIALAVLGLGFDGATVVRGLGGWYMGLIEKARNGDRSITPLSIFPPGAKETIIAAVWRAVAGIGGLAAAFYERRQMAK
jgi:hypothetical protein